MKTEFERYNGIPRPLQVCIRKLGRKTRFAGNAEEELICLAGCPACI